MPRLRGLVGCLALVALGGCASKGDLRRVEDQLLLSRGENQRADSARAAQLADVLALQRHIMDSLETVGRELTTLSRTVVAMKGDVANDLISVQQQALTGQSQQRITALQTQLEARSAELNAPPPPPPDTTGGATGAPTTGASDEQMYAASLQQLRRGSPATARMGFREMLRQYPSSSLVPDATYFLGETFAAESPDSASVYYQKVVQAFPQSPRAASSLYKLGLLAERRKDLEAARDLFSRVVRDFPSSDEAALARDRLKTLGH